MIANKMEQIHLKVRYCLLKMLRHDHCFAYFALTIKCTYRVFSFLWASMHSTKIPNKMSIVNCLFKVINN